MAIVFASEAQRLIGEELVGVDSVALITMAWSLWRKKVTAVGLKKELFCLVRSTDLWFTRPLLYHWAKQASIFQFNDHTKPGQPPLYDLSFEFAKRPTILQFSLIARKCSTLWIFLILNFVLKVHISRPPHCYLKKWIKISPEWAKCTLDVGRLWLLQVYIPPESYH